MSLTSWGIGASEPLPGPEDLGDARTVQVALDKAKVPRGDYNLVREIHKSVLVYWADTSRRNEETVLAECYRALTGGRFKSVTRSAASSSRTRHGNVHHFAAHVMVVLKQ